ncbi:hypothetical protein JD502_09580 [Aeromonas veronii]|uniref:hypothetical protein n=1 Tax=Aeromonas veronii TaxID=654 RepID=UPI00191E8764|nr:hypothetical protein [Aeromonas veronii]MBL0643186.1 hypothetical protein [Aeromonas veronii]
MYLFILLFSFNQPNLSAREGLPSGRKKGLRRESGKPLSGEAKASWQNVAQVLPKLAQKGKRANIPATGIWRWLTKNGD